MELTEAEKLADDVKDGLEAPLRLHREAALQKLDKRLQDVGAQEQQAFLDAMCTRVLQLLPSKTWQHRLGGFDAGKVSPYLMQRHLAWVCSLLPGVGGSLLSASACSPSASMLQVLVPALPEASTFFESLLTACKRHLEVRRVSAVAAASRLPCQRKCPEVHQSRRPMCIHDRTKSLV